MLRHKLLTVLIFTGLNIILCQQTPIYSQYILNEFLFNPSVAGIDGMTTVNITGRKQWIGFSHSPETYSATASTRILKSPLKVIKGKVRNPSKGRVGLGASFVNDRNGAIQRTSLQLTYAYHIYIQNSQLSFGLSGSTTQFKIDESLADFKDNDPMQGVIGKSAYMPDAGVGVNWSKATYNIGFSAYNLLQSPIKFGDVQVEPGELKNIRQYTLYGFYRIDMNRSSDWIFEPALLIRGNENLQVSSDISARFIYLKEYWTGISFRTTGDFILLLGLKVNRAYFGYSFDYGYNEISRLTYGSHEISIALKLGDPTRRYRWYERY